MNLRASKSTSRIVVFAFLLMPAASLLADAHDFASASPTTDGERLYCWFGSAGLLCYDLHGKKLWNRDLGKAYMEASLGEGCSPVVHDGRLVIVRDQQRQSYIEVLDAKTGDTRWKADRNEPNAWATPMILDRGGKTQVITAASNMVRSYDLYFNQSNQAIPSCLDSKTGDVIMDRTRLSDISNIYASPVGADGRVYITGRNGTTLVLQRSKELKVLARNKLDDRFAASPALAGSQLFLRGGKFLYCIQ